MDKLKQRMASAALIFLLLLLLSWVQERDAADSRTHYREAAR
jgi:hypothetical protein